MTDRIIILDGHSLMHRAFHAIRSLTSPSGQLTNAVFGFTSMLLKACAELQPRYAVAAFDTSAPTFRHIESADYKATRQPAAEGLHEQFPLAYQVLDALNIPIYRLDGFEADDLVGTLSKEAARRGLEAIIISGDLDMLQLVGPRVKVLAPRQGVSDTVLYDEEAVRERYGLKPDQLVDFKALRGDVSDNIPGVPGIGEKTAARLLRDFGSLDELYAHLDQVPPKLREPLERFRDQVYQSRRLATIVTDLPVQLELERAELRSYDRARLLSTFHELGFRSLLDRLPSVLGAGAGSEREQASAQLSLFEGRPAEPDGVTPAAPRATDGLVRDQASLEALVAELQSAQRIAFNVQATSLDPMRAALVGIGIAVDDHPARYLPLGHAEGEQLPVQEALARLRPFLGDESIPKLMHNAKYSIIILEQHGVPVEGLDFDTMIAAYLLESTQRTFALRDLAWRKLQVELPAATALLGSGKRAITMAQVDPAAAGEYARQEADLVRRLVPILKRELDDNDQQRLFCEVELPLVPVLASMEQAGVAIDTAYLRTLSQELHARLGEIEAEIYRAVGHQFNVASPSQLSHVLFEELHLPKSKRTRTGQVSTGAEVLEELRGIHPVVDLILEHRQLQKLIGTYVDALPALINPRTGRVHTSFNQTMTATGRLSSSDPNLQNIPIRTELGRRVRRAFVAGGPQLRLLSADYAQIELRILAHITGDPTLVQAFEEDQDIHAATAAEVLGIPISQVTADQRRLAKMVNFGVLYGMSEYGLAARTDLPQYEAGAFIDRYFSRFATIKRYQDQVLREAERRGYVTTLLGRRRYIPELKSPVYAVRQAAQRAAINHPIQGTQADIIKLAMIRIQRYLRESRSRARMILQVHDELVFEVPEDEVDELAEVVRDTMVHAFELSVPVRVDVKVGSNWEEMTPLPQTV